VIVDSSAIVAILKEEPGFERYVSSLDRHRDRVFISAGTHLETAIVTDGVSPIVGQAFDRLMKASNIEIVPFTEEQARIARAAYRDFGRGSGHPARLNFGDCFAYALAVDRDEPLLYQGDDFGHTDVRNALEDS
jgi:ribonuclease VapC